MKARLSCIKVSSRIAFFFIQNFPGPVSVLLLTLLLASVKGTASTILKTSSSSPPSPQPVHVAFFLACKQYTNLGTGDTSAGSWVTTIGRMMGYLPEVAASISGGGFSNYFVRPEYQQQAVSSFLQVEALEDQYAFIMEVILHAISADAQQKSPSPSP